ncbi:MAG: hypothetical protein ACOH2R_11270 [Pseudomonas sp.]
MNTSTEDYAFLPPTAPAAALEDGLLKIADLENPLLVNIQLWNGARPGYHVQLMWDDMLVGQDYAIPPDAKPGDLMALTLAPEHLTNQGPHQLGFRATNNLSGVSNDSPTTPILIDQTPPGAALLGPVIFPDTILIALLPSYAGMAVGDIIQTQCNGTEGPSAVVHAEHLVNTPVTIQFDRSLLQRFDSEKITITYQVTDRAGNNSRISHPFDLTLQ